MQIHTVFLEKNLEVIFYLLTENSQLLLLQWYRQIEFAGMYLKFLYLYMILIQDLESFLAKPAGTRRVVIDQITPSIDGGRHPFKRVVGDWVAFAAHAFADSHDLIQVE